MVKLIALNGATCSGKTTVCKSLANYDDEIWHLSLDNFYKDRREYPDLNGWTNLEHPDNFRYSDLEACLIGAKNGTPTGYNGYNVKSGACDLLMDFPTGNIIIIEGLYVVYQEAVRRMFDLTIFLEIDEKSQRKRWSSRERKDISYFDQVVLPMQRTYLCPLKESVDFVIDGTTPLPQIVRRIKNLI